MLFYHKKMRKIKNIILVSLITLICGYSGLNADTSILEVDPTKSYIKFTARHLIGGKVEGEFLAYSAIAKLKNSSTIERIEVMIDTNTIDTKHTIRDRHLRQPKFLDYKNHDYITFIAEGPISLTDTTITGILSIKGVLKEVEVPITFNFLKSKISGQLVLSSKVENFIINRSDYKVGGLSFLIRDKIIINIELINRVYVKIENNVK
ncbi:hypothetical protein CL647_00535 [bacterium]|nr:hypothetical protein [bacterium]